MLIDEKYEVISKIKQGGFGIVYYGFDRKFDKPIAIKAIEPNLLQEAKYIDMFLEEAKNAAKLNHNNIVHVYDLIKSNDGQFYIIMEYIDGVDLQRVLKRCRTKGLKIPLKLSIYIIKEICKALEYAHNKRDLITNEPINLVHQDISPSNIMISANGTVKLIDFGIAGIKFNRNGNGNAGQIMVTGKLPYLAPEQLNGGRIDRRADIFSLGSVFYETLTNEMLFSAESDEKIVEAIKRGRVNYRQLEDNQVPESVQKILVKTLQRNLNDRYQGANNIYIDLVEYLMTSIESVELSAELGQFVQELFQDSTVSEEISPVEIETAKPEETNSVVANNDEVVESDTNLSDQLAAELASLTMDDEKAQAVNLPAEEEVLDSTDEIPTGSEVEIDMTPVEQESSEGDEAITPEETDVSAIQEETKLGAESEEQEAAVEDILKDNTDFNFTSDDSFDFETDIDSDFKDESVSEEDDEIARLEAELQQTVVSERSESDISDDSYDFATEEASFQSIHHSENPTSETVVIEPESVGKFSPVMATKMEEDEEGDDDVKTVIDVIRLSAQNHKRPLIIGGVSTALALIIFMVLNVFFGWTATGRKLNDHFWPPAIRIYSAPQGAKVFIDGTEQGGVTPLSIPEITPGLHTLTLAYPGYPTLTRSLQVPSKGELQVDGETTRKGYEPYVFSFKTQFELNSDPPGATIYINNTKINQKTPAVIDWKVGEPLKVDMSKPGFQELTGFSFNTLEETAEIEDNRLWNFTPIQGSEKKYIIEGLFKRFVKISSVPSSSSFYLDGSSSVTGKTGAVESIALSVGKHDILFTKPGYISKRVSVTVDEMGPSSIFAMLSRDVKIFSKDETDISDADIGATVIRVYSEGKSYTRNIQTPCEMSLPPVEHKVLLRKQGYKDVVININPNQRVVVARMQPQKVNVDMVITDALSGLPLSNAQVMFTGLNGETEGEIMFGMTDEDGICSQTIIPGQYTFRVSKNRYFEKTTTVTVDENKRVNLKLIIQ
ncbi:protein kinase [candidate division KSB1 bacterium]|nr:protein kinase [candidate division KSB1 bacterium]